MSVNKIVNQTFAENYFTNIIIPKTSTFYVSAGQNRIFT